MSGAQGDILRFYTIPRRNFFCKFCFFLSCKFLEKIYVAQILSEFRSSWCSFMSGILRKFCLFTRFFQRNPWQLSSRLCSVFLFCCRRCSGSYPAGKSPLGGCGVGKPERARAELVEPIAPRGSARTSPAAPAPPPPPPPLTLYTGTSVNGSRNFLRTQINLFSSEQLFGITPTVFPSRVLRNAMSQS